MPLMKSGSKKAFKHNLEVEMEAHPEKRSQDLAIAYSVQRKAKKKKMAEGGMANESAASERRPMPEERDKDSKMVSRNSEMKAAKDDKWTDQPTVKQFEANDVRGKKLPIKAPKMVPSSVFSTRLYDKEGNLMESASPGPYDEQPSKDMDEEDANKSGPALKDMADEHSTDRKPYAKGGKIESSDYSASPNKHEDDLTDLNPSEDEGEMMADSHNEMGPDRQGPAVPDMEEPHNQDEDKVYGYADGGEIDRSADDSEMQPEDEEHEEHHNSIAAAVMARRKRLHAMIDSGAMDMDEAVRMAEGGSVDERPDADDIHSHDSIYSDDSSQVDLSRNSDEDANEEDQLSFNALRKENYSESAGLRKLDQPEDSNLHGNSEEEDSENKHDMISSIRRKISSRRQF